MLRPGQWTLSRSCGRLPRAAAALASPVLLLRRHTARVVAARRRQQSRLRSFTTTQRKIPKHSPAHTYTCTTMATTNTMTTPATAAAAVAANTNKNTNRTHNSTNTQQHTTAHGFTIEKSQFARTLSLRAIAVPDPRCVSRVVKALRKAKLLLALPRIPCVVVADHATQQQHQQDTKKQHHHNKTQQKQQQPRFVLLHEEASDEHNPVPPAVTDLLQRECQANLTLTRHDVVVGYESMDCEAVLRQLLPPHIPIPTSFESVGRIAHVNLRDEQLPYKYIIGAVLLDKNAVIDVVVNKVGTINAVFRVFRMEVIAGTADDDTGSLVTVVKEHGCQFKLDFAKVYWNSRLGTEHQRIACHALRSSNNGSLSNHKKGAGGQASSSREEVLCDMFAGIGPFAIPAARGPAKAIVYANDLNPHSYRYLCENIKLNKVDGRVHAFNLDARAFVRMVREKQLRGQAPLWTHIVMNLPATALEFLDVFRDLDETVILRGASRGAGSEGGKCYVTSPAEAAAAAATGEGGVAATYAVIPFELQYLEKAAHAPLPKVHCYCFSSADDKAADVLGRAEAALGVTLELAAAVPAGSPTLGGDSATAATAAVPAVLPAGVEECRSDTPGMATVRFVRNVAPKKDMLCVTFRLPRELQLDEAMIRRAGLDRKRRKRR